MYREEIERENDRIAKLELLVKERLPPHQAARMLESLKSEPRAEGDFDPSEETDRALHLVWEQLCIDDACEVVPQMRSRVHRIFELERLVREVLGKEQAPRLCVEFLALVSRCYVFGFYPECVALCRSAMESAFRAKVSDTHCEAVALKKKQEHEYGLDVRIQAAFVPKNHLLQGAALLRAATDVKKRGDKVIHGYEKEATRDACGTIKKAILVIDALSRLPDVA